MEPAINIFLSIIKNEKCFLNFERRRLLHFFEEALLQIERAQQELGQDRVKILLVESDRTCFVASLLAGIAKNQYVFLGTNEWSKSDQEYVLNLVQPNLIIGDFQSQSIILEKNASLNSELFNIQYPILIPTGGSSGKIKFAWHAWSTLKAATEGLSQFLKYTPLHTVSSLPLYHVSGLMPIMRALMTGGQYVDLNWNEIKQGKFPSIIPKHFQLSLVPTQLERLLQSIQACEWLKLFKEIFIGGAKCSPELIKKAHALKLPLVISYGLTETAAIALALPKEEFLQLKDFEIVGKALPHVCFQKEKFKIKDGRSLFANDAPSEIYEPVVVSGPSVFFGYYPEVPTILRKYATSDEAVWSASEYILKLRRSDSMIISGGKKIHPSEVQKALRKVLENKVFIDLDIEVIGVPHKEWGTAVVAVIASNEIEIQKDALMFMQMKEQLKRHLQSSKIPKYWVFLNAIPKTPQGKVDRAQLLTIIQEKLVRNDFLQI